MVKGEGIEPPFLGTQPRVLAIKLTQDEKAGLDSILVTMALESSNHCLY